MAKQNRYENKGNIIIGKVQDSGYLLLNNDLCIIVTNEYIEKYENKKMIWHVDYKTKELPYWMGVLFKDYEDNFINKGNDTKANREKLIIKVRRIFNVQN